MFALSWLHPVRSWSLREIPARFTALMLVGLRDRLIRQRTQLANAIRAAMRPSLG